MSEDQNGFAWPLSRDEASDWTKDMVSLTFPPLLRATLVEWADLKQRCRMKSLSRRNAGKASGLLARCKDNQSFFDAFDLLPPGCAYALLVAMRAVTGTGDGWQVLIEQYCDAEDQKQRAACVAAQRSLSWIEEQDWLYEAGEYFEWSES